MYTMKKNTKYLISRLIFWNLLLHDKICFFLIRTLIDYWNWDWDSFIVIILWVAIHTHSSFLRLKNSKDSGSSAVESPLGLLGVVKFKRLIHLNLFVSCILVVHHLHTYIYTRIYTKYKPLSFYTFILFFTHTSRPNV